MEKFYNFMKEEKKVYLVFLITILISTTIGALIFAVSFIFSESKILKSNMLQIIGCYAFYHFINNFSFLNNYLRLHSFTYTFFDIIDILLIIFVISQALKVNKRSRLLNIKVPIISNLASKCLD